MLLLSLALMQVSAPGMVAQIAELDGAGMFEDEALVMLPTYASENSATGLWTISVHGWIFEPEPRSKRRRLFRRAILEALEDDLTAEQRAILNRRLAWFVVDNERGERTKLSIGGLIERGLPLSGPDGHFTDELSVPARVIERARTRTSTSEARIEAIVESDQGAVAFDIPLLSSEGLSVISDIDDTVKITEVPDKKKLLANTFARAFEAAPGMPGLMSRLKREGAAIHYVSAGPWALYIELRAFFAAAGLPVDTLNLRPFRTKDKTAIELVQGSESYKLDTIERIITRLPQRRFILIGDSGERDPEVYGELARRHPQIDQIWIRQVEGADNSPARFERAFAGTDKDRWQIFEHPRTLEVP